ncbi:hypothetical protein AUI07_04335 [archaeon 13_2_20CM_2_53_6]|nr:MAG: hypothetical protein AUI07_04335 [archaeon 13_2_20CM_2_53_6]
MGRSENGGKGSTNTEAAPLERNQDQGVDTHEQGKETQETEEGKSCSQEESAGTSRREGRSRSGRT